MSVTCGIIAAALEKFAPLRLAEDWDNVGLLIGSPDQKIEKILLTLDVTPAVVAEAAEIGANLLLTHHPFPFRPGKTIRTDRPEGALLASLLKRDIAVYAAHTNLDSAPDGVNDVLASTLGLIEVVPLKGSAERLMKLAVYVPTGYEEKVWQAMAAARAGHIGRYSHCSFQVQGTGTFLPTAGTRPFIGTTGNLEQVREVRIETIVPAALSDDVIEAMLAVHPYEEAAYDLYPLENVRQWGGMGRIGSLSKPVSLRAFAAQVGEALHFDGLRFVGDPFASITRVAVCGGAGMELAGLARMAGADVLVTGDIRYHDAQASLEQGLCLIDAGHFATEYPILRFLRQWLDDQAAALGWGCSSFVAGRQTDVWRSRSEN